MSFNPSLPRQYLGAAHILCQEAPTLSNRLLPPAYLVRREGTVFTGVCLSTGGEGGSGQVPPRGGYPGPGTPPRGGTRVRVPPPGGYWVRYPPGGGTRVGQQKEYSLHGGPYASCVHAGGLSCFFFVCANERTLILKGKDIDVVIFRNRSKCFQASMSLVVYDHIFCGYEVQHDFASLQIQCCITLS